MTSRDFCFWLQGFFEIGKGLPQTEVLSKYQTEMIQRHLALVFKHEIDPAMSDSEQVQNEMNTIHHGLSHLQQNNNNNDGALVRC